MTYQQSWLDSRLKMPNVSGATNETLLPLDSQLLKLIWTPDVFVTNGLNPTVTELKPLWFDYNISSKQFISGARQVIKTRCPMTLHKFPMDIQTCPIELSLIQTPKSLATLRLADFSREATYFPNFHVTSSWREAGECRSIRGTNHACLRLELRMFRRLTYYFFRYYGPSILIVLLGMIGFFIPPNQAAPRVSHFLLSRKLLNN